MALTDQPYLPLYVDDWMNNNNLKLSTAGAHGLMVSIMCIMHKENQYGTINLKAKFKQTDSKIKNFAIQISKLTCFDFDETYKYLTELLENSILKIEDDILICKRMVKDASLSIIRSESGSKGGKSARNTRTKKLYNEAGFLYLIKDFDQENVFKIGISKEPEKRLKAIIYKTGKNNLRIIKTIEVADMGTVEDNILIVFESKRDGEWIYDVHENDILEEINKYSKSKTKANAVIGIVNENVIENVIGDEDIKSEIEFKIDEVLNHFIKITGKEIDVSANSNRRFVKSRLKDKIPIEDLKKIIELKTFKWKDDSKMRQYLRIETLFNETKCNSYLTEVRDIEKNPELITKIKQDVEFNKTGSKFSEMANRKAELLRGLHGSQ